MADEAVLEQEAQSVPSSSESTTPTVPVEVPDDKVVDIRQVDGSGDLPLPASAETPSEEPQDSQSDEVPSLRDAASHLGYDVSNFEDDESALTHLITQARNAEQQQKQLAQYQQLMAAQQQAQSPQQPAEQEAPLWNPPEFNPVWLTQVQRDEQGNLVPAAGGSQETVNKVLQWAQYRQEQQDKFWNNPYEYIRPFVENVAKQQTQHGLETTQDTLTAQQLIDKNSDWIYEGDPNNRKFTPEGELFYRAAQQLPNATPKQQFDYAMTQVEKARMQRELEQLKAQQQSSEAHEQKKKAAVNSPKPNSSGTFQQLEQNPDLTLQERMMAAFKANGIESIDFEQSV